MKIDAIFEVVFLKSASDKGDRDIGRIDRQFVFHAGFFERHEEVRNGADVVFVGMGHEEGMRGIGFEDAEIRRDEVNAEVVICGKKDAAIDEDTLCGGHHQEAVHAEHACPADGEDFYKGLRMIIITRANNVSHVYLL